MGKVRVGIVAAWIGFIGIIVAAFISNFGQRSQKMTNSSGSIQGDVFQGNKTETHIYYPPNYSSNSDFETIEGYCMSSGWGEGFRGSFYMAAKGCHGYDQMAIIKGRGKGECKDLEFRVETAPGPGNSWNVSLLDENSQEFQTSEFYYALAKKEPLLFNRFGKSIDHYSKISDAVNWLNKSEVPFQIYKDHIKNNPKENKLKELLPKNFQNLSVPEMQKLALTSEGQHLKRAILNYLYPAETPENKMEYTALGCNLSDNQTECKSKGGDIVQVEEGKSILRITNGGNPTPTGSVAFSMQCRWLVTANKDE